jgi:large subunit ribosomal protein L22
VWIEKAKADQGPMKFLRRYNAGPQGRAMPYVRNMCHLTVVVSDSKE